MEDNESTWYKSLMELLDKIINFLKDDSLAIDSLLSPTEATYFIVFLAVLLIALYTHWLNRHRRVVRRED